MKTTYTLLAIATLTAAFSASAQNIERVKMTDNELTCQQIYGEIGQMDGVIARGNTAAPGMPGAPATVGVDALQVAGAANVLAAAQNSGVLGNLGGFGGGFGSLFSSLANAAAQSAAAKQASDAVAAQQVAAAAQQGSAMQSQQAQARKEHLTSVFLSKGCKMSDIIK